MKDFPIKPFSIIKFPKKKKQKKKHIFDNKCNITLVFVCFIGFAAVRLRIEGFLLRSCDLLTEVLRKCTDKYIKQILVGFQKNFVKSQEE